MDGPEDMTAGLSDLDDNEMEKVYKPVTINLKQFLLTLDLIAEILFPEQEDPFEHMLTTRLLASSNSEVEMVPSSIAKPISSTLSNGRMPKLDRLTPRILCHAAVEMYLHF